MLISEIPNDVGLEGEALLLHDEDTVLNDIIIRSSSMNRIPQEPYEMVLNDLLRKVFVPGTLQPDDLPVFNGPDCFANTSFSLNKARTYRIIDTARFDIYKDDYWTQNTWARSILAIP